MVGIEEEAISLPCTACVCIGKNRDSTISAYFVPLLLSQISAKGDDAAQKVSEGHVRVPCVCV